MGATTFGVTATGSTAQEAFNRAVEQAGYESGHGGYTGTIAEKHGFVMIKCPTGKNPREYAEELIENDDRRVCDKWGPAGCIVIEEGKENTIVPSKTKLENFVFKGTREWETWYVAYSSDGREIFKTHYKDEAVNSSRDISLKRQISITIKLEKRLKNSSEVIAKVSPVPVVSNAKTGKYYFFGWASC